MQRWLLAAVAVVTLMVLLIPSVSYTEDQEALLMARTLYALARDEDYDTKLALGTVVMNRVENVWFADTVEGVLTEQMQFPISDRYDDESLRAAHEVLSGARSLSRDALYYQPADAREPISETYRLVNVGGYIFYSDDGRL